MGALKVTKKQRRKKGIVIPHLSYCDGHHDDGGDYDDGCDGGGGDGGDNDDDND